MEPGRKLILKVAEIDHETGEIRLILEKTKLGASKNIATFLGPHEYGRGVIIDFDRFLELIGKLNVAKLPKKIAKIKLERGAKGFLSVGDKFEVIIRKHEK